MERQFLTHGTILRGALSWFLLELSLLEETVESVEARVSKEVADMNRELLEIQPKLDAEWGDDDDEQQDPSDLEIRYADLDSALWARKRHSKILRSALFLATYSAFEQCLDGLAREWREARALDLNPTDLRHRGIERSKAYLTKVVKLPFPSDIPEWTQIYHLRAIRNQLAHDGPNLSEAPDVKLRGALEAFPGIYSEDSRQISLSDEFLPEVFKTLQAFTNTLIARNVEFTRRGPTLLP